MFRKQLSVDKGGTGRKIARLGDREASGRMRSVLIVDDDYTLRKGLRRALELDGCRVEEAASVEEAIARVSSCRFNLAVLDHDLGKSEKTGVSLLLYFRENKLSIPVLFISGSGSDRLEKIAKQLGARLYLEKPFGVERFLTSCRKLLSDDRKGL